MLNVGRALKSRKLTQKLGISRAGGRFTRGGWVDSEPVLFETRGIVAPSTPKALEEIPEADRVKETMMFYTPMKLEISRNGDNPGNADRISWQNRTYKVAFCKNYTDYGYARSVGVRVDGD